MAKRVGFGEAAPAPRRRRPVVIAFLIFWLCALSCVIALVWKAREVAPPEAATPMIAWLAIAALGWVFGLFLLLRALRGRPPRTRQARRGPLPSPHDHADSGGER